MSLSISSDPGQTRNGEQSHAIHGQQAGRRGARCLPIARLVRQAHPGTRVLFTSGFHGDFLEDLGSLEPHGQFLARPFNLESLASKVLDVLNQHEKRTFAGIHVHSSSVERFPHQPGKLIRVKGLGQERYLLACRHFHGELLRVSGCEDHLGRWPAFQELLD